MVYLSVCLFVMQLCGVSAVRSGTETLKRTSSRNVMWAHGLQCHADSWRCGADNTDVLFAVWHTSPAWVFVYCKLEPVSRWPSKSHP